MNRRELLAMSAGASLLATPFAGAQTSAMPGITATEIRLGQTNPYSGPLSAYAAWFGKVQLAYCSYVNDQGGINGRKIKLLSYDDGYQPPRTVEQVRKLVESDQVAAILHLFGTAPNRAGGEVPQHEKDSPDLLRHQRGRLCRPANAAVHHAVSADLAH